MRGHVLYKAIASAATRFFFLQLDKLKLAKGLEDVLQVTLSDAEVDVAYVEPVERDRVRVAGARVRVARLTVLLGLGQLRDDRDP